YAYYAFKRSKDTACLASLLHHYRYEWMLHMLEREVRIADAAIVANLERGVSFFASTTMLVLAGLITVLGAAQTALSVVNMLPLAIPTTEAEFEIKLLCIICLFVYAFFKFTWSLRQYGFLSVMVGGAPQPGQMNEVQKERLALKSANMGSIAANNFNAGLRAYYYGIAMLGWFISPWLFMISSVIVVAVLYRREFKSATLRTLTMSGRWDHHESIL
ncbi:MAG: DUF599 domain-containing protein, partial [Pontibacterium sp.]